MESEEIRKLREELAAAKEANLLLTRAVDRLTDNNTELCRENGILKTENERAKAENELLQAVKDDTVKQLFEGLRTIRKDEDMLNKANRAREQLEAENQWKEGEIQALKQFNSWSTKELNKTGGNIQIIVRTLYGKTIPMKVHQHETIENLKIKFEEKENVPPDQQRWIFGGQQLEDSRTISFYQIHDGFALHMVLRLAGRTCSVCKNHRPN